MKGIAGIAAIILLILLVRRVVLMIRLAKSDLDRTAPDTYGFLSLANSKAFWWTLIPFILATIVYLVSQ